MINNIPKIGEIIIVRVITNEITSSNIVKRGFIKPPVNTEEDPLIVKVANWNPPVIETPVIKDNIHCNPGGKSLKEEADNMVPAKIDAGVANVSNKLSIQGMKNAQISTTVAKASIAKTKSFPIQVQPSPNWTNPALYNKP